MFQSPRSRKIGAAAALVISWSALYWLFSLLPLRHEILFRIGFLTAALCATGAFVASFAACLAYIGRKQGWSPRTCHMAGIWILIPGALVCASIPTSWAAFWIANLPVFTGYICGKLVHPELTDDEAYAPEPPLTLFPK
ncbi:MAG: hypothetical protein ACRD4X_13550 [Candidatus Acidiferrales bacterium]